MNRYYVYEYKNGLQFVSTAPPEAINVCEKLPEFPEKPQVKRVWHVKKIKGVYQNKK